MTQPGGGVFLKFRAVVYKLLVHCWTKILHSVVPIVYRTCIWHDILRTLAPTTIAHHTLFKKKLHAANLSRKVVRKPITDISRFELVSR